MRKNIGKCPRQEAYLNVGNEILEHWQALLLSMIAVTYILAFLTFWYADIGDTLDNSVMLWECMAKNKGVQSYYQYAAEHAANQTVYSANYNVLFYGSSVV